MSEKTRAYPKQTQIKPIKTVSLQASARQDAQGVLVLVLFGENIDTILRTRFQEIENNSPIYLPLLFNFLILGGGCFIASKGAKHLRGNKQPTVPQFALTKGKWPLEASAFLWW